MLDIDAEISAALAEEQRQRAAEQAAREEGEATALRQAYDELMAHARQEIDADLLDAFDARPAGDEGHVFLALLIDGQMWELRWWGNDWRVQSPTGQDFVASAAQLRMRLLLAIAAEREARAALLQRETEREAARQAALTALWRWPEGREVVLYHWRWCIGEGHLDEYEYDEGWGTQDHLDAEGYVRLARYGSPEGRIIKLHMQWHKPIIERLVFGSTDQLPLALYECVYTRASNDVNEADSDDDDDVINVGTQPVAWLRALVDERR